MWPRAESETSGRQPGSLAVVGVSSGALAAGTFGIVAFGALAPELQDDLGLSNAEIGLLSSLVFVGASLTSRPAGRLTDRRGPAGVLGAAMAGFGAALALAAWAPTVALLMAAVFVAGLAYGLVNPPTNVVVAGRLARRVGFFLSVKQSGVPLGALLAGVVLPPIALATHWRVAFLVPVAASLAVAAATPLLRNAATASTDASGEPPLARREILVLGSYGFVMSGTQWTFISYLTLYLTKDLGFGLALAGIALGVAQLLGAAGRLTWGWLSDTPGRRLPILFTLTSLSAASLALVATGIGRPLVWVVVAVAGFAIVGWNGAYHAMIADRAGPGRVGRASGDSLVFIFSGTVVLPPLLGLLVDGTGEWWPLWAAASALVAAAGLLLRAGLRTPTLAKEAHDEDQVHHPVPVR